MQRSRTIDLARLKREHVVRILFDDFVHVSSLLVADLSTEGGLQQCAAAAERGATGVRHGRARDLRDLCPGDTSVVQTAVSRTSLHVYLTVTP